MNWERITPETKLEGIHFFRKLETNGPHKRIIYGTGFADKQVVSFVGIEKPLALQDFTHYIATTPPTE